MGLSGDTLSSLGSCCFVVYSLLVCVCVCVLVGTSRLGGHVA